MEIVRLRRGSRPYLDLTFPRAPAGRPYVVVNMVGSLDGKAVIEGDERGLGSPEDKRRMQELRAHADAVMNGAGTLRASGASSRVRDPRLVQFRKARGKREQPLGVIVTTSADFALEGPYFDSSLQAVVLASAASARRRREIEATGAVLVANPRREGLRDGLRYLRRRGVRLLVCEGGPSLNAELLRLGALDEIFVTLSPTLVGGEDTLTILEGKRPKSRRDITKLRLLSALYNPSTAELYLRYRVRRR